MCIKSSPFSTCLFTCSSLSPFTILLLICSILMSHYHYTSSPQSNPERSLPYGLDSGLAVLRPPVRFWTTSHKRVIVPFVGQVSRMSVLVEHYSCPSISVTRTSSHSHSLGLYSSLSLRPGSTRGRNNRFYSSNLK